MGIIVEQADVLKWAEAYSGPKFHALLSDPPYHMGDPEGGSVGFMNQEWDGGDIAFRKETWEAFGKHLFPGAFGMAFASSRGWHRLACAIEDAGFVIHPSIFGWVYGSGFPKGARIDTQIQPKVEQLDLGANPNARHDCGSINIVKKDGDGRLREPTDPLAREWMNHRYGLQALKPAIEPIIVFQKPYEGKPYKCMVEHGAGALNVGAARVKGAKGSGVWGTSNATCAPTFNGSPDQHDFRSKQDPGGRWPANFVLSHSPDCKKLGERKVKTNGHHSYKQAQDGGLYKHGLKDMEDRGNPHADAEGLETVEVWECVPDCPVALLDKQSGGSVSRGGNSSHIDGQTCYGKFGAESGDGVDPGFGDSGGASRFFFRVENQIDEADPVFYCTKASRSEREGGIPASAAPVVERVTPMAGRGQAGLKCKKCGRWKHSGNPCDCPEPEWEQSKFQRPKNRNPHPAVKPLDLNRWLATLLLPPQFYSPRRLLVPFAGVMSEAIGANLAGWDEVLAVERDEVYVGIGKSRIVYWGKSQGNLFG